MAKRKTPQNPLHRSTLLVGGGGVGLGTRPARRFSAEPGSFLRVFDVPGFRAHLHQGGPDRHQQHDPGFQAHLYRDLRHEASGGSAKWPTGISGTAVPGLETEIYRAFGHRCTGTQGRVREVDTVIRGTKGWSNRAAPHGISRGNFVLCNLDQLTTSRSSKGSGVGERGWQRTV